MKATIHDFDVGPTEEEEDIAKAWVEQDPAVEMERFDVREKLATAAAYGLAAGRAACSRGEPVSARPDVANRAYEATIENLRGDVRRTVEAAGVAASEAQRLLEECRADLERERLRVCSALATVRHLTGAVRELTDQVCGEDVSP